MDKGPLQTVPRPMAVARDQLGPLAPCRPSHSPQPCAALRVESLSKRYRHVEAIADISFTLHTGQRLALLGPNGAGKTTLIRCLAGRTLPDGGTIQLLGHRLPPRGGREHLGLVPQEIALYSDLTAHENLTAFARFHGLRGRELKLRVQWALAWTGLADRQHELVGRFSGGMKRRVNLACGVMHSPAVLLLDEPTVGVDPQSRQRIFQMLDQLRDQGTSILLTTHHLDEAQQSCDRIVIVDHGRVVADGTLDQLVQATVGSSRTVRLRLDRPLAQPLAPWRHIRGSGSAGGGTSQGDHTGLQTRLDDVAGQLPQLLEGVTRSGYSIVSVEVHAPSLHDVFLHLTGQELRD